MTGRVLFACLWFLVALTPAGCGDGAAPIELDARPVWLYDATPTDAPWPIDAPPPDACTGTMCDYSCVDLTSDPDHCGECDKECSPAAGCADSDCSCPSGFIPATLADGDPSPSFSLNNLPVVSLRASFVGNDALPHQLRLYWDSTSIATGVDYDLAAVDTPSLRISYNRSDTGPRGNFVPSLGTLQLSRVCNDGVAGTLGGATLVEIAFGPGGGAPIPDGCSIEVASLAFDFGSDCQPQ